MHDIQMKDIWLAKKRIQNVVKPTPMIKAAALSQKHEAEVFLKLENLNPTGSFKLRGATNKILALSEAEQKKGVTTFSTGNHGLAVAFIAKKLKIPAVICISNRVPEAKVNKLEALGAEIKKVGYNQDDAERAAYTLEKEAGLTVIPPFDDKEIIAGQGTIGIEMIEMAPDLDIAVIPVSGGGLFSGIAYYLKQINPAIHIVGVSMEKSAVMYESIKQGRVVELKEQDTLADSLLGGIGQNNQYTFQMVQSYIDEFILLTEAEIAVAMKYIFESLKLVVEGAAATGLAVLYHQKINFKGKNVATVVTGHNVDTATVLNVIQP